MIDLDYGYHHIARAWRLIGGDEAALDEMDISADGFWRSFGAIVISFPAMFFSWVIDAKNSIFHGVDLSMGRLVVTSAFLEIIIWLLPILLLALVLKPLNLAHRFTHLIIVRNWFSVPIYYLFAVLASPALLFNGWDFPSILSLLLLFAMIWILIRLTISTLQCGPAIASALVIGETIIMIGFLVYLQFNLGIIPPTTGG